MLSVNRYSQEYIDSCRAQVASQLAAYDRLLDAARELGGRGTGRMLFAIEAFEPLFFNHMVLALDNYFCHRSRTMEGRDGNPLNEVRVLCNSLMTGGGVLLADKTIKLKPEASLLGHAVGDPITLDEADFRLLSDAFFAEIEAKYR